MKKPSKSKLARILQELKVGDVISGTVDGVEVCVVRRVEVTVS